MTILVTGGAGFIGSNFVLHWLGTHNESVVNVDKLTYAGHKENLESIEQHPQHFFVQADINNSERIAELLRTHTVRAIVHFAAESHVDRSITGPEAFIQTNVLGTFRLLETTRHYWADLPVSKRQDFRFLHVSTDEVYGSLGNADPAFTEKTCYEPNSPYSASKAAADHCVRAYHHTYGLPTLTTHCSNNYGPYHYPEKLIPLTVCRALHNEPLWIYGQGLNIRDWLYVGDHVQALDCVLKKGRVGETYNIGGSSERTNVTVVHAICDILDRIRPRADQQSYRTQIQWAPDRLGHDHRYAIDASKIKRELGWEPTEPFDSGLLKTIQWMLDHPLWVQQVTEQKYGKF